LGEPETLLADTGYFSAANVEACEKAGIEPLIAMGRQPHHPPLVDRTEHMRICLEGFAPCTWKNVKLPLVEMQTPVKQTIYLELRFLQRPVLVMFAIGESLLEFLIDPFRSEVTKQSICDPSCGRSRNNKNPSKSQNNIYRLQHGPLLLR
jgi:hypothetical protein